jgi:hypothetical protein
MPQPLDREMIGRGWPETARDRASYQMKKIWTNSGLSLDTNHDVG